jgi:hypothetical protein
MESHALDVMEQWLQKNGKLSNEVTKQIEIHRADVAAYCQVVLGRLTCGIPRIYL